MPSNYVTSFGGKIKKFATLFWGLSLTLRVGALLILVGVPLIIVSQSWNAEKEVDAGGEKNRVVKLQSVSSLSQGESPLTLLGTVTSKSEARVRAEVGGRVVGVYKRLGDYVSAGSVIAEFENSSERALVLQAEGAYESATAGKNIAGISLGSSDNALVEAKTQALNVITATYAGLDDAVRTKTDAAWTNPLSRDTKLRVTVADAKLVIELEALRIEIEKMLVDRESKNRTLVTESDLIAELGAVEREANIIKNYLDQLSLAFNRSLPDGNASVAAIEGYKASTAIARGSVGGLLASITNVRNALQGSMSGNLIAELNSGAGSGSSASGTSDAQIKSALGNLRGAQARLEKTIVRSPISGTINSLTMHTGDFISPFTEVAVVANNGALEVVAYVTEDDAKELVVLGKVKLENDGSGVITRIAPALDPNTKKIEVRIGVTASRATLTNGASLRVEATRATKNVVGSADIKVPLAALKITPNGSVVFTVSASSTLVAHPVNMGALLGDHVAITGGVTPDMEIVTDARGLQDGMAVIIK